MLQTERTKVLKKGLRIKANSYNEWRGNEKEAGKNTKEKITD